MSTGTEGLRHYDVTREALIEALASLPLGEYLTPEARGRMADALLAAMPTVPGDQASADLLFEQGQMAGVRAERKRVVELAATEAAKMRASDFAEHEAICAAALEDFAGLIRETP